MGIVAYVIIGLLVLNLVQRQRVGQVKRRATLYAAVTLMGAYAAALASQELGAAPGAAMFIGAVVLSLLLVALRRRIFVYRLRCSICHRRLSVLTAVLQPRNRCRRCRAESA